MTSRAVRFDLIGRDVSASRAFDKVGKKMTMLEAAGARVGHAIRAGLLAGTAAVAGIGVVSVKSAVDFQSAMTKISTQAGGTRKDVKVLSDQVLKLGGKVQQAPQQLAEALYHLKSVGMDDVDAMKALRTASDLAAVGHADLEETTNALAGAWRTGIKGATSFGQAAATVNSIIGAGNMTMEQFTEALSSGILPAAKTFGLSLNQVGAALALFTDEGVPASDAATRLRMSISLLGAPSAAAEKQLKKIGLTGLDLAKAMRGPQGIIGAISLLKDHLDKSGLSAAQQSQILSRAFGGGRSSAGILALINNLDVLKQKQDQVNSSTGRYADAVKQQRKTAEAELKRLESGLQTGAVRLGTVLLPPLTSFVGYIDDKVIPAAGKFGSHIGNLLPMSKLKADFKEAEGYVGDFLKGLTGFSGTQAKKLPTPELKAPKVITPLAPGESQAQKFGETIRTVGIQLAKDLKPLADASLGVGKAFVEIATHTPAPVLQRIVEVMIATSITKRVVGLATAFRGLAVSMAESWTAASGPFGVAVAGVLGLAYAFSAARGTGANLAGALGVLKDALVGPYGIWGAIKQIGKAFEWVFGPHGGLTKNINNFNHWLGKQGSNLIHGFVKGAKDEWHNFTGWFTGTMPNQLIAWVESGFGIASPAKKMMPVGANVIRGFLSGAWSVAKGIGGWVLDHVKAPTLGAVAGAGGWLVGKGGSAISGFISGLWSKAKSLGGWFSKHVHSPISGSFSGAGRWLYGSGVSVLNGLFDGLKAPWSGLHKWVSGIAGWIKAHKGPISLDRKLLHPAGVALMSGLLSGLKLGFKDVGDFVYHVGDTVAGSVKGLFSKIGLGDSSVSGSAQQFAQLAMRSYGWGPAEWPALKALWNRESGWNYKATNPSSGAYGIPQALPASKMSSAGSDWRTNPDTQIRWGLSYIKSRYGSPSAAWAHEGKFNWYAKGTGGAAPGWAWVGEKGPELVRFGGGETVLSHPQSMQAAVGAGIRLPGYASGTIQNAADRVSADKKKVEDAKDALSRAKRRHKGEAAAEKRLKAAEKELAAAEVSLKNAQRSAKTSISNTIATGLQKTLSTGTASAITSAIKSLATKLLNAGFNKTAASVQKTGGKLEALATKRASIASQITAANKYATDQASNITDFLSISGTSAMDVGGLISQLSGQEKTASGFVSLTKSLKARGASKALLQQLSDAGPGSQLATILGAKSVTTGDISKLNSLVASGGKLATSFGRDMADLMYDSGKDASKGFLAGLKSQEKALDKQMSKLASDLVKSIKKALKIKSPSQVFRDEVGKQVALGMVVGMDAHRPHIAAAAQRMAMTARKSAVLPSLPSRQSAAFDRLATLLASGQAAGTEVHIHFDDPALKDLIRAEAKPMIKQSESTQAYRARVGRRSG